MKKIAIITFLLLGIFILTACSEKDSNGPDGNEATPPVMAENYDLEFIIPAELDAFTSEDIDYNGVITSGYSLDQFISQSITDSLVNVDTFDSRKLFAVQILSSDEDGNWTPRDRGLADLTWNDFVSGYLLPDESGRTYFPETSIAGTYNVKYATYLQLYRKIDVILDGTVTLFETGAFPTQEITYIKNDETLTELGFPLEYLISDFVTDNQDNYTYKLIAADNFENSDTGNVFSWEDIQCGYWLTEKDRAIFANPDSTLKWKSVKYVEEIQLTETN